MSVMFEIFVYLYELFFGIATFVLLMRILLQFFRASVHNPVCQLLAKLTNPIVLPLRNLLPRYSGIDLASVLVLLLLEFIKFVGLGFIWGKGLLPLDYVLIMVVGDVISQLISLYFLAIIIHVIISWVGPSRNNPFVEVIRILCDPVLNMFRKFIKPISGFDLSPLFVLIILQIASLILRSFMPV